jgi:uncharacterized protein YqeY
VATIEEQLRSKLTAAIKARDLRTANCIRMVNTKVMERRTAKGFKGEVNDDLHREVIAAYKKSLEKARKEFEPAGEKAREQIAELDFEIEYLAQFLPQALSDDEVRAAVRAAIAELPVKDAKMSGRVVGAVMKELKGRVEADTVKRLVAEEFGSKG